MKKHIKRLKLLALALLVGAVPLLPSKIAHADPLGQMTLYSSPSLSTNHIVEGPDGNLWIAPQYGSKVIKMSRTGSPTTYNTSVTYHGGITVGSDNNLWATNGSTTSKITTSGSISHYNNLPVNISAPASDIAAGPDGNIWTANSDGSLPKSNLIKRSVTGTYLEAYPMNGVPITTTSDKANNVMWYGVRKLNPGGGYAGQSLIGKMAMDGSRTEYDLPASFGNIFDITMGPDGNAWFVGGTSQLSYIGKITSNGITTLYPLTSSLGIGIYRIAAGKDGNLWATLPNKDKIIRMAIDGSYSIYPLPVATYKHEPRGIAAGKDGNMWVTTYSTNQVVRLGTGYTDDDEDGLQYSQEMAQGTTDNNPDFDSDGLSDYVESTEYTARDDVFCNSSATFCEYPDPISKDIYIENDWMDKPDINGSGYSMQLNSAQVSALKTSFLNKNIQVHIDTGQLGGGNEVSYTSLMNYQPTPGIIDFYDYKNGGDAGITPQFAANRKGIYHYLITGQTYTEDEGSTGASYMGDDDFFVSYGLIKENFSPQYLSLDTAIAGTVMHELGHGLCLSGYNNGNPTYPGQPASCRYAGIDAFAGSLYGSVMNYDKQLLQVDYSSGINGLPDDHNDWDTIRLMDFAVSSAGDAASGKSLYNPTLKNQKTKRNDKNTKLMIGPNVNKLKNAALQR